MLRGQKQEIVEDLHGVFASAGVVIVTHYMGLTVAEITDLRGKMRDAGATFRVTKNRLAQRSLAGTEYEPIATLFTGPTAVGISDDPTAAPRVLSAFAKKNEKLKIVGGGLAGSVLDEAQVKALAELPSLDELRGKILGMINTPATRIAGILQAPGGQIARVLSAHAAQG